MKILYIANVRIPTEMAHGLQIMKMCEAFAKQGVELELLVPWRFGISELIKQNPFKYYRVEKNFKVKKLFCIDLTPLNKYLGPVSFLTQAISFAVSAFLYSLFNKVDIIYSRDRFSLWPITLIKNNLVYEVHQLHRSSFKFLFKKIRKLVVITKNLKEDLIKKGIDGNKILVASDGISLKDFDIKENQEECRKRVGLPQNKRIILYTGHLYRWKGVETLAMASKFLGENDLIVIVGGIKWYLSNFKDFVKVNDLKNVLVVGHKDYAQMPYYLGAADCLMLTGTKASETSQKHTSPMKMFEYMASQKPIIASDLPSFKEILNEANCILVEPDHPWEMAMGIMRALNDAELSKRISEQAFQDVQKYNWDNRARTIINFINN